MSTTITLKEFLGKGKTFVIPAYQRGYVWGKNHEGKKNSVEYLIGDLLSKFRDNKKIFLQGFTVTEKEKEIILIDGQQRSTFLYLLLKYLGYRENFTINYDVREKSHNFLIDINNFFESNDFVENEKEEYQDIYFFKKTMRIITENLQDIDKQKFLHYITENINFLYINIPEQQATKIFTMMNGNKAQMQQEEIIKAELLRLASLHGDTKSNENKDCHYFEQEWECNMIRSRYAREWDKWLRWWNDENVRSLYGCNNNMGWLIPSYLQKKYKQTDTLTFEYFKEACLKDETSLQAKQTFDGLRRLQKRFEDAYNDYKTYNMIGAILRLSSNDENKRKFIQYYFVKDKRDKRDISIQDYYKLVSLKMTHDEIIEENKDKFYEKFNNTYTNLNNDLLYENKDCKESAFCLLLRLNIEQDNKQERCFNFDIWENRSLEHIYPKSKVLHKDGQGNLLNGNNEKIKDKTESDFICRETITKDKCTTTEHSIGNLVLLYKNENSAFNNNNFLTKKEMFFNPNKKELIKSKQLLHTVCVFAEKEKWTGESIAENKMKIMKQFEEDYNELKTKFNYGEQE